MLHILWMVIKFILILLGIILGLLLLAVLLVLFCPFRYHVSAEKQEEDFKKTSLYASASWLFHGVWIRVFFQEGKLVTKINLFGIPIHKILEKRKSVSETAGVSSVDDRMQELLEEDDFGDEVPEIEEKKAPEAEEAKEEKKAPEPEKPKEEKKAPEAEKLKEEKKVPEPQAEKEKKVPEPEKEIEESGDEELKKAAGILEKIKTILGTVSDKLKNAGQPGSLAGKVSEKINTVREKLQGILDKIKWWKNFLTHAKVKGAVNCAINAVLKILKHVIPTRLYGNITVGSDDPAVTGRILAVLGMTIPFHKNCIEVTPVFDGTKVLKGKVHLRGRIYTVVLLYHALKVIINKNVRYTIKYWKNKEES